jgi:dUTP pyrophosphatase
MLKSRGFEVVESQHRKTEGDVLFPVRKTKGSAGYDFMCPYDVVIYPDVECVIWTDVKAYMQEDEVLKIYIRSSLAIKHGIVLVNGTGIIDSDYHNNKKNDGNIGICIRNTSSTPYSFKRGEGIAQGIFQKYLVADNCNSDNTRTGGIGSTNE